MSKLKISRAEASAIQQRLADLKDQDAVATSELAEATHNGAETWHDNAAFDAAKDKKNLAEFSTLRLTKLLQNAEVVEPDGSVVAIGTEVVCEDLDSGDKLTFKLAGDGAWVMDHEWASAQAPIGAALLGAKVGDERRLKMGVRSRTFKVLSITIV